MVGAFKSNRTWLAVVLVLAAGTYFLRLGQLAFVTDEIFHGIAVKAILSTGKPVMPDGSLYLKGALFSYLAALFSFAFGSIELGVRSVSAICALGNTLLVYATVVLVTKSCRAGVLAAIVWAFHPWTVEYARWGRLYGLASVLLMASVYTLMRYDETQRRVWMWISIGLLCLATTLYPFFVWCWLVIGFYLLAIWASRHPQHHRKILILAIALVSSVFVIVLLVGFYGDYLLALASKSGWQISQFVGRTGERDDPDIKRFLNFSDFYLNFFFRDLKVFSVSLVGLLVWTCLRADPLRGRRKQLLFVSIALGGVVFVTFFHLQAGASRYLFPIFPIAVVGSVMMWERLLRVSKLSGYATTYISLVSVFGVYYFSTGAFHPVTREYGEDYYNSNFGPTPSLTVYNNFRSPVDIIESMRSEGDTVMSNKYQFYYFYSDREPDFSLKLGAGGIRARLAGYMSHTRELRKCISIDRIMLRQLQGSVWLGVNGEPKIDACLSELMKKHPIELVSCDKKDTRACVYRMNTELRQITIPDLS